MALRIRQNGDVVCAAEEPPLPGDRYYLDDPAHASLAAHFKKPEAYTSEPGLCWHCKIEPDALCERCGQNGFNLVRFA